MGNATVKKIATATWDATGEKIVNTTLLIAMKQLAKSLQNDYNVKQERIAEFSDSLSMLLCYIISQNVHNQCVDKKNISKIISTGLVPSVASIASNNPKGAEIVSKISSFVGNLNDNVALETIISQFASNDVAEQLQEAVNSIASLNSDATEENSLQCLTSTQEASDDTEELEVEELTAVEESVPSIPVVKENMTDEEDEEFVNSVSGSLKMDFSSPEAAAESFDRFVRVAGEVAKFSELQETKRTQIRADAEVAIKKVEAMRDVLKDYLEKSFDERSKIFLKQFEVVDKALATGDNAMLSTGLTAINELAASSPFKALADINSVQQMLTDDSELDI